MGTKTVHGIWKNYSSPSGNWTPVSRVTGGDTHHYTNEDEMLGWVERFKLKQQMHFVESSLAQDCVIVHFLNVRKETLFENYKLFKNASSQRGRKGHTSKCFKFWKYFKNGGMSFLFRKRVPIWSLNAFTTLLSSPSSHEQNLLLERGCKKNE